MTVRPIGYLRSSKKLKFEAPSQPENSGEPDGVIELNEGSSFEQALKDLSGFDRIWVIWWFDRNRSWKPLVLPPRGAGIKRGVFATRSPHRPNPIGISAIRLLRIQGRKLFVGKNDLLDGTAILDLKPYISEVDAFNGERQGWVEDLQRQMSEPPHYEVLLELCARQQHEWLKDAWNIDIVTKAIALLGVDPSPHATRRIEKLKTGAYRMGCGAWRLFFELNDNEVRITSIAPGYPLRSLTGTKSAAVPQRDAQLAFLERWPATCG